MCESVWVCMGICVCVREQVGVCLCTHFRQTEDSLWYGSVPQGAGIWHIVFVGNSNHLQLSTCFDPFRKFHFLRSFGEWLQRSLWKEKPHYGFSASWKTRLEGQCQPHRCSFPVLGWRVDGKVSSSDKKENGAWVVDETQPVERLLQALLVSTSCLVVGMICH